MNPHENQSSIPTPRQFFSGFTTGLVAASAAPALGQESKNGDGYGEAPGQLVKLNPLDQFPKPPFEKIVEKTALERAGQPAELAPAIVLLASQESSFVTGHLYDVQGGSGEG